MAVEPDFISDLIDGTEDTISANTGNLDPNRGTDDVRTDTQDIPANHSRTVAEPKADGEQKQLSLREQISSSLKGSKETPAAAQQDGGPARNPDGTFAPKVAVEPVVQPEAQAPAAQPVPTPRGLSAQDAEVFAKLPAELQQSVARTMESLDQRGQRYAEYDQLEQVIGQRRQAWAINGATPAQAVNQLLALSDFATRSPKEFVTWFAQNNNVDLEEVLYGAPDVDPAYAQLQQQVQTLQQQLGGMTQQQQQAQHQNTVNEIIAFAEEKDASGNLVRPYFNELGDTVLPFIQMVQQQNPQMSRPQVLQEAYDRATWGNPTVRVKMQQAAQAAQEAARIQEQQAKAAKARAAGVSVPNGVPTAEPAALNGSRSLRDTIRAAMAEHS